MSIYYDLFAEIKFNGEWINIDSRELRPDGEIRHTGRHRRGHGRQEGKGAASLRAYTLTPLIRVRGDSKPSARKFSQRQCLRSFSPP